MFRYVKGKDLHDERTDVEISAEKWKLSKRSEWKFYN